MGALSAGVVELVDARDSKSRSERSVGSIPTARTIQDSRLCKVHRTGDRSLHQRTPKGRTARAPLREMTIERHCHAGTWHPSRDEAIATN